MIAAAPLNMLGVKDIQFVWQDSEKNKEGNHQCKSPVEDGDEYFTFELGMVLYSPVLTT